eukprot:COSAG06_NODE_6493_length_2910_cov_5.250089_4_plen_161_part_00
MRCLGRWQTDLPAEVVAKFYLTDNMKLRLVGFGLGLFANEVNYYSYLQPTATVRSPQLYFGDIHYPSNRFLLIMEKVDGTRNFLKDAISDDDCRSMLQAIARFHAPYLGKADAPEIGWCASTHDEVMEVFDDVSPSVSVTVSPALDLYPRATCLLQSRSS